MGHWGLRRHYKKMFVGKSDCSVVMSVGSTQQRLSHGPAFDGGYRGSLILEDVFGDDAPCGDLADSSLCMGASKPGLFCKREVKEQPADGLDSQMLGS
jgi:hypothetical protein